MKTLSLCGSDNISFQVSTLVKLGVWEKGKEYERGGGGASEGKREGKGRKREENREIGRGKKERWKRERGIPTKTAAGKVSIKV